MKPIAIRGNQILIHEKQNIGFIYDIIKNTRTEELNIQSILARGYWHEYEGEGPSKEELERIKALPVIK